MGLVPPSGLGKCAVVEVEVAGAVIPRVTDTSAAVVARFCSRWGNTWSARNLKKLTGSGAEFGGVLKNHSRSSADRGAAAACKSRQN